MSPVVTDVQIKRNGVAAITVDDGEDGDPVVLPLETVVLHHLRSGNHLTPEEWSEACTEGRKLLAVRRALDLLSRRQRTEHELRTALGKSFAPEEAAHAVERMGELGYLNDDAWAANFVRRPRAHGRGRMLLQRELKQRGVDSTIAATAVEEHDECTAALEAARKRIRSLRKVEEPKRSRRLYDFLRRRGFTDAVTREAMSAALQHAEREDADPAG